jgi:hypothetical protein
MNRNVSLGRTARPRWNLYTTDGLGRDTYISFNNGGFWTSNIKEIKYTPNYPVYHNENYHSLGHSAAPFKYYSDGSGRDSYIIKDSGGLKRDHNPLSGYHLKDFLRTPGDCVYKAQKNPTRNGMRIQTHFVSPKELAMNNQRRRIEKGLVTRLYKQSMDKKREQMALTEYNAKSNYIPYLRVYRTIDTCDSRGCEECKDKVKESNVMKLRKYEFGKDVNECKGNAMKTCFNFYKNANPKPVLPVPKYKKKMLEPIEVNNGSC